MVKFDIKNPFTYIIKVKRPFHTNQDPKNHF